MRFPAFILKNLIRRPIRSLLTVIGMGVAICAVVALRGVAEGFQQSFLELYQGRGVDLVVLRAGAQDRLMSTLDEDLGREIRKLPGVKNVTGGLLDFISFEDEELFLVNLNGWEPDSFLFDDLKLLKGRKLKNGDKHVAMLGQALANGLRKKVGDKIELYGQEEYTVVGVFQSFSVYENGGMVIPLDELQDLTVHPKQVTGYTVILDNSNDKAAIDRLRKQIEALRPQISAMATDDYASSTMQFQIAKGMANLTSLVGLIVGAIGMMNTMVMSVFERTGEIGLLRAIGWRRWRVWTMIICESEVLSLAGAVVGSVAAVLLTKVVTQLVPMARNLIEGRVDWPVILVGFAVAGTLGLFGAALPAWWGANLHPTEALRKQ